MKNLHYFAPAKSTVYPRESIMDFLEYTLTNVHPGTLEELIFEVDLARFHAIDREIYTPTVLYYLKEILHEQRNSLKRLHIRLFREEQGTVAKQMTSSSFLKPCFEHLSCEIGGLLKATHVSLRGLPKPNVRPGCHIKAI